MAFRSRDMVNFLVQASTSLETQFNDLFSLLDQKCVNISWIRVETQDNKFCISEAQSQIKQYIKIKISKNKTTQEYKP